jgi:hypothetical protein
VVLPIEVHAPSLAAALFAHGLLEAGEVEDRERLRSALQRAVDAIHRSRHA